MTNDEKHNGGLIQIKTRQIEKREDVCPSKRLDLATVDEKIDAAAAHDAAEKTGPQYWRSLEELAGSPAFQEALHREFPKGASEWLDKASRRGFLKVMGASLGLAGMTGCVKLPLEPIVPYVRQPENVIPGRPQYYATAMTLGGYANPLLVESHLGRPTKIEGNDQHPASLGGTDIFAQASILTDRRVSPRWAISGHSRHFSARFADLLARKRLCRVRASASSRRPPRRRRSPTSFIIS